MNLPIDITNIQNKRTAEAALTFGGKTAILSEVLGTSAAATPTIIPRGVKSIVHYKNVSRPSEGAIIIHETQPKLMRLSWSSRQPRHRYIYNDVVVSFPYMLTVINLMATSLGSTQLWPFEVCCFFAKEPLNSLHDPILHAACLPNVWSDSSDHPCWMFRNYSRSRSYPVFLKYTSPVCMGDFNPSRIRTDKMGTVSGAIGVMTNSVMDFMYGSGFNGSARDSWYAAYVSRLGFDVMKWKSLTKKYGEDGWKHLPLIPIPITLADVVSVFGKSDKQLCKAMRTGVAMSRTFPMIQRHYVSTTVFNLNKAVKKAK